MRFGKFQFGDAQFGRSIQVSGNNMPDATFESPGRFHWEAETLSYTEKVAGLEDTHWLNNITRALSATEGMGHHQGTRIAPEGGTLKSSGVAFGLQLYELHQTESISQDVPTIVPKHFFTVFSVYARCEQDVDGDIILSWRAGTGAGQNQTGYLGVLHRMDAMGHVDQSSTVPKRAGWYRFFGTIPRFPANTKLTVSIICTAGPILVDNAKLELCPVYARGRVTRVINSTTFEDNTKSWSADELFDKRIIIIAGKGESQTRLIVSHQANRFTLGTGDGVLSLDTTSEYYITDRYINNMEPTPYIDDWQTVLWLQNLNAVNIRTGVITLGGSELRAVPQPRLRVLDRSDNEIIALGDNLTQDFPRGMILRSGAGILVNDDGVMVAGQDDNEGSRTVMSRYGLSVWENLTGDPGDPAFDEDQDTEKIRLGNLAGISDPYFGTLSGYGAFFSGANVYVRGTLAVAGNSFIENTLSVGSGIGPFITMGEFSPTLSGLVMRDELGRTWWSTYFNSDSSTFYWSITDPSTPNTPLLTMLKRAPQDTYEYSVSPQERYFLEINASALFGDLRAERLRVDGTLSSMVGNFGLLTGAALAVGVSDYQIPAFRNGVYLWNGYPSWVQSSGETMGFEFWKRDFSNMLAMPEKQGGWDFNRGALVFGDTNANIDNPELYATDGQLFLRRSKIGFWVDRRENWRPVTEDSAPGFYWSEYNASIFSYDEGLPYGVWTINEGSVPEEGDAMGRIIFARLSPRIAYEGVEREGSEQFRTLWIESYYKNQDITNSVRLMAYGLDGSDEHQMYTGDVELMGGSNPTRESSFTTRAHNHAHQASVFRVIDPGTNNMLRIAPDSMSVYVDAIFRGRVGFFNGSPASKPTVTGSRGGNAALASLLTALSGLGLLTDSSS